VKSGVKIGAVVLLVLSVLTIFISPAVDLQPTALRALKMANLLFAFLALAGTAFSARLNLPPSRIAATFEIDYALLPPPDFIDLNCTRLC
jgi:hypothetical protein